MSMRKKEGLTSRRDSLISFKVTPKEKKELQERTKTEGFDKLSHYLRYCVFQEAVLFDRVVVAKLKKVLG